jgi:hypothetical protein
LKTKHPIKNPIFRFGKFLLIGCIVLVASLFFLYPQVFYCELIRFSGFKALDGPIYFSPELRLKSQDRLKKLILHAEARVDSFYSGRKSRPVIILCSNPEQYQRYCSSTEGAGCSLGTPWGDSYVILNVREISVDVISHEMSHLELLERLGWWTTTTKIPQWFNEGIALMLDRRFVNNPDPAGRYLDYMEEWQYNTRGGQEVLELAEIASIKGFFNGGQKHVMLAYMSSGMEVAYWLALSGESGLSDFISNLKTGGSFEEAYKISEKERLVAYYRKLPSNPLRLKDSVKISE